MKAYTETLLIVVLCLTLLIGFIVAIYGMYKKDKECFWDVYYSGNGSVSLTRSDETPTQRVYFRCKTFY